MRAATRSSSLLGGGWCGERQRVKDSAEGDELALSDVVVSVGEVIGDAIGGGDGLVPGVGRPGGDWFGADVGEAVADLGQGEVSSVDPDNHTGSPRLLRSPGRATL